MTPTATRLKARLDTRLRWYQNEWFFKWHHIGGERSVEIDMFDGSAAHYAGISFCGSSRDVYWDALVRGVRHEITEQFTWADHEVRNYNRETALRAIDEGAGLIASFVRSIRRAAIKKDRILRGDGINIPPEDDGGWWDGTSDAEIQAQAEAIKAALPFAADLLPAPSQPSQTRRQRAVDFWNNNQWWLGPLGLALGVAGILPLIL